MLWPPERQRQRRSCGTVRDVDRHQTSDSAARLNARVAEPSMTDETDPSGVPSAPPFPCSTRVWRGSGPELVHTAGSQTVRSRVLKPLRSNGFSPGELVHTTGSQSGQSRPKCPRTIWFTGSGPSWLPLLRPDQGPADPDRDGRQDTHLAIPANVRSAGSRQARPHRDRRDSAVVRRRP